jgi:ABC-type spermidine/putrescine transport system permease subunit II
VTRWEGFGLRWWTGDPGAAESILYDPEIRARLAHSLLLALGTTLLAVPIGTTFALGCRGWRSRLTGAGMTVVLLAVALPVIALAAAMWLLLAYPLRSFPFGEFGWFGTRAQLAGLTTMFLPIVALIIWTRLWYLDRQQEELATDLGAPPGDVVRRIILPQLRLTILAAAAVVFAGALSEFVLTDQLVGQNDTRAIGPLLLVRSTNAAPRVNAVGTALALVAAVAFSLMVLAFGPYASADARRDVRRPEPGSALRRPDPFEEGSARIDRTRG